MATVTETELREALEAAREALDEQDELLQRLTAPPLGYATVVATGTKPADQQKIKRGSRVVPKQEHRVGQVGKVVQLYPGDREAQVEFTDGDVHYYKLKSLKSADEEYVVVITDKLTEINADPEHPVKPGDMVKLSPLTSQIIDVAEMAPIGEISIVRQALGDKSELEYGGGTRVVFNGECEPEKGDRVILDPSGWVVKENLGKEEERFRFESVTGVTWKDIGGLEEAKQQMIEAVELPYQHQDLYRFYGKKPLKGVLLYGPPGCGKTMLGKATASALAAHTDSGNATTGFMYIKGPEILDRFVGVAEATIRQIFERARRHYQEHGYPAVIFVDEADAILGKRGTGVSSDMERTIVPAFLTEMDGLEDSGAIVILATNRSDVLDPAVVRDGRIDRKVKITRPTFESASEIFEIYLKGIPLCNGYSIPELAETARDRLMDKEKVLCRINLKNGQKINFTLAEIVNGAMIASTVDQATSLAMHRDIAKGKPGGLSKDDLTTAVDQVYRQNADLNMTDELSDHIYEIRDQVKSVQRVKL